MVNDLSDGDITKYEYVENKCDVDDYALWLAFQNRRNKIEKHFIDGDKNTGSWDDLQNAYSK